MTACTTSSGSVASNSALSRSAPSCAAPHAFWIYERRLVIVETISEELWLTGEEDIVLYERAWDWLADSAEYGTPARRLIGPGPFAGQRLVRSGSGGAAKHAQSDGLTHAGVRGGRERSRLQAVEPPRE